MHPLEYLTFSVAKNLSMSRKQLFKEMDAEELIKWISFEMLQDVETRTRLVKEVEDRHLTDAEKEAKAIREMFMLIQGNENGISW